MLEDAYPNFSICGIPYYISGDVPDWRNLAHRSLADLEATGMRLRLDTTALGIDIERRQVRVSDTAGHEELLGYDKLIIGTGAMPVRPAIDGLDGPDPLGDLGRRPSAPLNRRHPRAHAHARVWPLGVVVGQIATKDLLELAAAEHDRGNVSISRPAMNLRRRVEASLTRPGTALQRGVLDLKAP